jgi:hypothetical protein
MTKSGLKSSECWTARVENASVEAELHTMKFSHFWEQLLLDRILGGIQSHTSHCCFNFVQLNCIDNVTARVLRSKQGQ